MNVCNENYFSRKKAVRLSAELLRDAGVAFFPLDIKQLLLSFSHQIYLIPYKSYKDRSGKEEAEKQFDPLTLSKDGFCTRIRDVLMDFGTGPITGNNWEIYYNDQSLDARIRFTLMHEMGHVLLGHHQILNMDTLMGIEDDPEYRAADAQADQFSINALAPAPAVYRLLKEHGFSCSEKAGGTWQLTNKKAPFLQHLGQLPKPEELVMTAFGLSREAAERRLYELQAELVFWQEIEPELYAWIEGIAHRSGWYCWVCHTRRRTTSPYCPGCGKGWAYEYKDYGRPSRPVIGLRKNGQFAFCSVCGNSEYSDSAAYCPVCGCPVVNECENAHYTDGDFVRSGMFIMRGTHRCRPTDIYCGSCGVLTAFGSQHGPRMNMWLPDKKSERCRILGTTYPPVLPTQDGKVLKCPDCGSSRSIRDGQYCAECMQPLENSCVSDGSDSHACAPNDRYCQVCGKPTMFYESGFLHSYTDTETYAVLRAAEADAAKPRPTRLMIEPDGTMKYLNEEAH